MPLQTQGKRRSAVQEVPIKRFRVSRACDQCRTERSKCDGNQPQCAPCFEASRTCTYTSNPRKRGLPPGYIRAIELALALIFQQEPEIEVSLRQANTILLERDTKDSNRLHKTWRKSKFCRELNKTLTGEQGIDDEKAVSSEDESDGLEVMDPNIAFSSAYTQSLISPMSQRPSGASSAHRQRSFLPTDSSSLVSLPSDSFQLLEGYLTYTQSWLPISEKLDILKLSYSYPSRGLLLAPDMPQAGGHAEMWSMLALGACQTSGIGYHGTSDTDRFYAVAQSLVPRGKGTFSFSHIKALLNLALCDLQRSNYDAAWLLVGAASRILPTITEGPEEPAGRRAHVVAGCFLLDRLLALALNRRPYMNKNDIETAGQIEEDGLEEWQPWDGRIDARALHQSRSPTLSLSSLNALVDVVDILTADMEQSLDTESVRHDRTRRLSDWKAALPPKFEYIQATSTTTPLTPPAILLQLTHLTTSLYVYPSQMWLQRFLDLMDTCHEHFGPGSLPPVIMCLLSSVQRLSKDLPLDQTMIARIDKTIDDSRRHQNHQAVSHSSDGLTRAYCIDQTSSRGPSQNSPQLFAPRSRASFQTQYQQRPGGTTSLLNDLLPDMATNQQLQVPQIYSPHPIEPEFTSPTLDAYDPSISGDLDSFFDELASLHGAKKLENQPQFMQNLGFAPEVSMADLLATQSGQYMPMDPSTFRAESEAEPLQFPLSDYYNPG